MTACNCPRCHEELRVPSGEFPEDAYAQCPWCRETFPLSNVLTSLPPMLEILSADGQPIAAVPRAVAAGLGGGALAAGMPAIAIDQPARDEKIDRGAGDFDFDRSATAETVAGEDSSDSSEFDESPDEDLDSTVRIETVRETISDETWNEESSVDQVDDDDFPGIQDDAADTWDAEQVAAPVASMKVSPRRSQQKKGSAIKTAIMVVLGGLAAFPLAGAILWAVGRPLPVDLGFWPFSGASESNLRSVAAEPADGTAKPSFKQQGPSGRSLNSGLNGESLGTAGDPVDSALDQIMDSSVGEEFSLDSDGGDTAMAGDDDTALELPTDPRPAKRVKSRKSPVETPQPKKDVAASKRGSSSDAQKPPPAQPVEEESSSDESAESIAAADRAVEALLSFEGPEKQRRGQLVKTYAQIAAACDVATGPSDALRGLAQKIGNSSIQDEIGYAGSQWLGFTNRDSDGIALIGQPGTSDEGPTLTLDSRKVVRISGGESLPSANKVLAMGRIVDDGASVELVLAEPLQ